MESDKCALAIRVSKSLLTMEPVNIIEFNLQLLLNSDAYWNPRKALNFSSRTISSDIAV